MNLTLTKWDEHSQTKRDEIKAAAELLGLQFLGTVDHCKEKGNLLFFGLGWYEDDWNGDWGLYRDDIQALFQITDKELSIDKNGAYIVSTWSYDDPNP